MSARPPAPLVTVGIPFQNEERWLAGAVRSILGQTWTDLELLLVDDGSTDRSLEIARSFRDPRVQVVSDGRRRHLPARLNEIVDRARGELVARMDGDDVSHPDRLRREIEALRQAGDGCSAVGTWVALVDERDEAFSVVEASPRASAAVALERGLLPHATLLARRSWLAENRYDETLTRTEDRDLWCRTVERTRFAVVAEPLYVVRVVPRERTFLADYVESQRQHRLLIRRHGPRLLGNRGVVRACAVSHAKSLAMRAASAVGVAERLVARRGRLPTKAEQHVIAEAVAASSAH